MTFVVQRLAWHSPPVVHLRILTCSAVQLLRVPRVARYLRGYRGYGFISTLEHSKHIIAARLAPFPVPQVALKAVQEAAGNIRYMEFVLCPRDVFDAFVEAAQRVGLNPIPGVGGPAASEPHAEEHEIKVRADAPMGTHWLGMGCVLEA